MFFCSSDSLRLALINDPTLTMEVDSLNSTAQAVLAFAEKAHRVSCTQNGGEEDVARLVSMLQSTNEEEVRVVCCSACVASFG